MLVRCIHSYKIYRAGRVYDRPDGVANVLLRKKLCFEPAAPDKPRAKREKMK